MSVRWLFFSPNPITVRKRTLFGIPGLFVDGQLLERLEGRIGEVFNVKHQRKDRIWYQETLIFPLKQLGDTQMGFNGKVKNLICTPR